MNVHEKANGKVEFLTKGDNNQVDDRGLYGRGQKWLQVKHLIGRVKGYLPYIGFVLKERNRIFFLIIYLMFKFEIDFQSNVFFFETL